jgi:hypothetical protein
MKEISLEYQFKKTTKNYHCYEECEIFGVPRVTVGSLYISKAVVDDPPASIVVTIS